MIPLAPLLADAGEWIRVAFILVPFVIYVLNRVLGGEGKAPKPDARRPVPARPVKPVAAPVERKRIDDEVGDFLRRAAQQRAAAQGQQAEKSRPAPPGAQPAAPTPARRPLLVDRPAPSRPVDTRTVEVEAVEVEAVDDVHAGRSVAAHVQQHLGGRSVVQRGPQGEEVEHAVQVLQSHLQETFDHEIGHLATRSVPDAPPDVARKIDLTLPTADQLRTMLNSPQGIGQAILLSEILRRPEERW